MSDARLPGADLDAVRGTRPFQASPMQGSPSEAGARVTHGSGLPQSIQGDTVLRSGVPVVEERPDISIASLSDTQQAEVHLPTPQNASLRFREASGWNTRTATPPPANPQLAAEHVQMLHWSNYKPYNKESAYSEKLVVLL